MDSSLKVSQDISTLSKKTIQLFQPQTTADLLQSAGNVFVQKSQGGGGSPVLRGFEANRICLVVNGVRMNNAIYRGGHLQNVLTLDNQAMEKVEILQGPASCMYGSDALGGVIHFLTRKPEFHTGTSASNLKTNMFFRFGSANMEKTGHADFNIGAKKIANFTSLSFSAFQDFRMGRNNLFFKDTVEFGKCPFYVRRFNGKDSMVQNKNPLLQVGSGYQQFDLVERLIFKLNAASEHGLNFQVSSSSNINRNDRLSETRKDKPRFAEWYYGPQKRTLLAYDYDHFGDVAKKNKHLHIGLNHQWIEESRHSRNFGSDFRSRRLEKIQVTGLNLNYRIDYRKHTLRLGGDMQTNFLRSTAEKISLTGKEKAPESTRYPDGKNQFYNGGVFVSHSLDLNPRLTLNEAIRFGVTYLYSTFVNKNIYPFPFSEVRQTNFVYSGSLGLVFRPIPASKVGALISSGYRSPNIDDLGKVFDSSPGTLIVPNPNLKPEKTVMGELSFDLPVSKSLRWKGTGFYTHLFDAIVTDSFSFSNARILEYEGIPSFVFANQNQQKAHISGFSMGCTYQVHPLVLIEGSMHYTYGRIRRPLGEIPLDHIPPLTSRLAISYQRSGLNLIFFSLVQGKKRMKDYLLNGEDNEAYAPAGGMPAWFTLNLRAQYSVNRTFEVYGGVENMLDVRYRTFASGINGAGRNFSITLKARVLGNPYPFISHRLISS